jgi:hypothetical protein
LPSASQFDCIGLSQFLPSTPVHSPVSSELYEDSSHERIDMAKDKDGHVPIVSRVSEIDPAPATVVSAAPVLSEAEIAALVATRLRRYSQVMVWDDRSTRRNTLLNGPVPWVLYIRMLCLQGGRRPCCSRPRTTLGSPSSRY